MLIDIVKMDGNYTGQDVNQRVKEFDDKGLDVDPSKVETSSPDTGFTNEVNFNSGLKGVK